jgi:hypothetical protein
MNIRHVSRTVAIASLACGFLTLVSLAHAEREVFRPTVLAPVATGANGKLIFAADTPFLTGGNIYAANNLAVGTTGSNALLFFTNSAQRMQINSTGEVFIGNGETAPSVANGTLRATGGSGTNIGGADLVINGGRSTGSAAGGSVRLFTSPTGSSGTSVNASVERMRIASTGRVGIGTTNPSGQLTIVAPTNANAMRLTDTETDATQKFGIITASHYTNSEEPLVPIFTQSTVSANNVNIGGGSGNFNTATAIVLFTAANNTTVTGTERLRINSTGEMVMTADSKIDAGASKLELPNGTTIPATCVVGEMFQDTNSNDCINTAGGDGALCICKTTNTWALIANF